MIDVACEFRARPIELLQILSQTCWLPKKLPVIFKFHYQRF